MTGKRRGRPPKATAEDWERAALDAIAEGGLAAVSVEALAARISTSKGSFYWYFPGRDALIGAALSRWEREYTETLAAALEAMPDAAARLRLLVPGALTDEWGAAVTLNLLADAADPTVCEVVRRVTERRLEVLRNCLLDLGFDEEQAAHRATAAYSLYLGAAALRRGAPQPAAATPQYAADMIGMLTAPPR